MAQWNLSIYYSCIRTCISSQPKYMVAESPMMKPANKPADNTLSLCTHTHSGAPVLWNSLYFPDQLQEPQMGSDPATTVAAWEPARLRWFLSAQGSVTELLNFWS